MALMPQLNVICGRCGKRREGLRHICVSSSRRTPTPKLKVSFGKCGSCGRPYGGNPLTHVCRPKSEFKRRKKAASRKPKAEKHDYQACADRDCPKPLCVAFRTGRKLGYQEGFDDGFGAGYAAGSSDAA